MLINLIAHIESEQNCNSLKWSLAEEGFEFCIVHQSNCLICLPDKSGDFLAFRAKTAQNTAKPEKTGFGMAIIARPRPVFCVSRPKNRAPFGANARSKVVGKS